MTPEQIVALVVALAGTTAAGSWVTAWFLRKKVGAEATQIIGEAYQQALEAVGARVRNLEAHVLTLESKRNEDRLAYDTLWERVRKLEEENYRLSEELKTERALTKRQHEKIGFLEARIKDLENAPKAAG